MKSTRYIHLKTVLVVLAVFALAFALIACSSDNATQDTATDKPTEEVDMVLASTTSTQDSGLFDVLIPAFEEANPGIKVQVIAVGTGEAIQKGRDGDADVLLVHSTADEEQFVEEGYADERFDVMYNDYVIVGSDADPAKIKGSASAADAFKKIADAKSPFVSRADDSGTHKKEMKIWEEAGITPKGDWYHESGQGMGETLKMADEMGAYTLSDRATFLTMKNEGAIQEDIDFEGANDLFNQYGVLVVKGAKEEAAGKTFAAWIVSPEGQQIIADYGTEEYGQPLFTPNAQ